MRKALIVLILLLPMAGFLSGCGSSKAADATHAIAMADTNTMPAPIRAAPRTVRDAYRFAAADPDTLKQIPCYCGCGAMGHSSNYNCFWQAEGVPDFTCVRLWYLCGYCPRCHARSATGAYTRRDSPTGRRGLQPVWAAHRHPARRSRSAVSEQRNIDGY